MEIKKKGKILHIKHLLKRGETYSVNEKDAYKTISIFKKPIIVSGISNATEDLYYIPFIDYDNVSKEIVLEDVKDLMKKYDLAPFYLFTTKEEKNIGNYHLINLTKLSYAKIQELLNNCRCDVRYKSMNQRNSYRSWVLRISSKGKRGNPKFLKILGAKESNLCVETSRAHLEFLQKIYKLPPINYVELDRGKKIRIHHYETFR